MTSIAVGSTSIEKAFRSYIWQKGLRGYRVDDDLPGKPDIFFSKYDIAVFIDGCFWHKCPNCYTEPKTRKYYWVNKIKHNVERDRKINKLLKSKGIKVIRFWEHEIKNSIEDCYIKLKNSIAKRNEFSRRMTNLKFGELFSGAGGLSYGALKAKVNHKGKIYKLQHSWASDYDEDSCQTYRVNVCPEHPENVICKNVHTLDLKKLRPVNVFAYGFPCNDFSIVGKQKGIEGGFGPLYTYGVKILNLFSPFFFIAENVGGIMSANQGGAFEQILEELENASIGYNLTTHLYKAEEYGVPQTRHRIIIVGFRKDLNKTFKVPAPTTKNNPITAEEALSEIPEGCPNHKFSRQSETVVERLKHIKPGQNAWNADIPEELQLNVKSARMSQIYKRLHPNRPSYTITGSGGGGTHGYHWAEARSLTNRERARIQTFPDDFVFHGGLGSVRKQIGMAVPPKLAQIIVEAALKTLLDIDYEYILNNNYNTASYE